MTSRLMPGTEYLCPKDMDEVDLDGFRQRLIIAREIVAGSKWNGETKPPLPTVDNLPARHITDYSSTEWTASRHFDNPFRSDDIQVAIEEDTNGPSRLRFRVGIYDHPNTRNVSFREPILRDQSNAVPAMSDPAAIIEQIDRWLALLDNVVWPKDPRLEATRQHIWQIVAALFEADDNPVYQNITSRLELILGLPYRRPQIQIYAPEENHFTHDFFLTEEAQNVFATILPNLLTVTEKRDNWKLVYQFSDLSITESFGQAKNRKTSSPIDLMKALQPFSHINGPRLEPNLRLNG